MGNYVRERCLNDRGYLDLRDDLAPRGGIGAVDVLGTALDAKAAAEAKAAAAKAWASKKFGAKNVDAVTQLAVEYAYAEGNEFIEELNKNPVVQRLRVIGGSAVDIGVATASLVQQYKKGSPDAAGILAWKAGIDKIIGGAIAFAEALGANSDVMAEVAAWTGVGTVCATSITAGAMTGTPIAAAAGAAVCLGAVLSQVLKYVIQPTPDDDRKANQYPAVFAPNEFSNPRVQRDAARLAQTLSAWYGVDSVASIFTRLKTAFVNRYDTAPRPIFDPQCNSKAYTQNIQGKPIPAVDTWAALVALDFDAGQRASWGAATAPIDNTRNGLFSLLKIVRPFETTNNLIGLAMRHMNHHDISATVVRVAATLGRTAIVQGGLPRLHTKYNLWARDVDLAGVADKWVDSGYTNNRDGWRNGAVTEVTSDLSPFIRLDELINFFVAVGERERAAGLLHDVTYAYCQSLPIRWYGVLGGQGEHYFDRKWTNAWPGQDTGWLVEAVLAGDRQACRELAYIRVLSAFSCLVTMYQWTTMSPCASPIDPIKVARSESAALRQLTAPLDPRSFNREPAKLDAVEQPVTFTSSAVSWNGMETVAHPSITQVPGQVTGLVGALAENGDPVGVEAGANGWFLAPRSFREQQLEQIMREAREAGVDAAYANLGSGGPLAATAGTPGTPQFAVSAQSPVQFVTAQSLTTAQVNPAFYAMLAAGLVQVKGQINPTFEENCIANGGTASLNAAGTQQCTPTPQGKAALEKRCRDAGGTPIWEDSPTGPRMRCQPPTSAWWTAPSGGSGVVLLALAAGLVYLVTRK